MSIPAGVKGEKFGGFPSEAKRELFEIGVSVPAFSPWEAAKF